MDNIAIIFVSLLCSAFFSGMEIAFLASNKLKIELDRKQGLLNAKIITVFIKNPPHYIATMLIGNNFSHAVYGIAMATILESRINYFTHSDIVLLIIQTVISTIIVLVFAEFLPKVIFRAIPNMVLNAMAVPLFIVYALLYPIVKIIAGIPHFILKVIVKDNVSKQNETLVFGKIDLGNLLDETTNNDSYQGNADVDHDIKIFQNALDFSEIKLRECFVPRTEIEAIDVKTSMEELKQCFIESGYSKLLVFEDSIDNIIGYVHSSELFSKPDTISSIVKDIIYVPESMSAKKMLSTFIEEKKNIAVVVDEFGGTAGIVTIEDIIEEIFGEIEDEHDINEYEEKKISKNEYVFSGRLEIDYINEKFGLKIPVSEDYETLAGFVLFYHENIPVEGEEITIKLDETFRIKVMKVSNKKIGLLNFKILE